MTKIVLPMDKFGPSSAFSRALYPLGTMIQASEYLLVFLGMLVLVSVSVPEKEAPPGKDIVYGAQLQSISSSESRADLNFER